MSFLIILDCLGTFIGTDLFLCVLMWKYRCEKFSDVIKLLKNVKLLIATICVVIACACVTNVVVLTYMPFVTEVEIFDAHPSGGSNTSSKRCRSCGKEFKDSGNKNSIKKRNMCKKCYNNFEFGMKSTGQW